MKFLLYYVVFWIGFLACHRKMPPETLIAAVSVTPECIQQKIASLKKLPVWNPPAQINEYDYNDQKVYLISARCCDFYSIAVDSNCNYICAPSGGFTGRGDGKCVDFNEKAKLMRLVWKDDRARK